MSDEGQATRGDAEETLPMQSDKVHDGHGGGDDDSCGGDDDCCGGGDDDCCGGDGSGDDAINHGHNPNYCDDFFASKLWFLYCNYCTTHQVQCTCPYDVLL